MRVVVLEQDKEEPKSLLKELKNFLTSLAEA